MYKHEKSFLWGKLGLFHFLTVVRKLQKQRKGCEMAFCSGQSQGHSIQF